MAGAAGFLAIAGSPRRSMVVPLLGKSHSPCGKLDKVFFADMHDGDQKLVTIDGDQLVIESATEGEAWTVQARLDPSTCSAMVDFDVPGKPSPPPVPLLLTAWTMEMKCGHHHKKHHHHHDKDCTSKLAMEFTDPSETIAPKEMPLNHWVQLL